MRRLQVQYFLSYAILGAISPLLSVFLKEVKGFDEAMVGVGMALVAGANLVSPSLITWLADVKARPSHLLAGAFLLVTGVLATMLLPTPHAVTLGLMGLYGLSVVAILPLQDGLYFATTSARRAAGQPTLEYPRVRVWGTVGFIVPSIILWVWMGQVADVRVAIWTGMIFSVLCFLRMVRTNDEMAAPAVVRAMGNKRRVPARLAWAFLLGPRGRWFCVGLAISACASVAYHYFVPLYLRNHLHVPGRWIPAITNLGVVFEVGWTLAVPWLQRRLGLRWIILGGLGAMIVRLAALGFQPSLLTILLVQWGHGWEIVALYVVSIVWLNRQADDEFRHSMQGAFSMLLGGARLLGSLGAGWLAERDILLMFKVAAGVALVGWTVLALRFHEKGHES